MKDTIYRQDAIDLIHQYFKDAIEDIEVIKADDGVVYDLTQVNPIFKYNKALSKAIKALPSAQPEPIRLWLDHELSKEEYERLKKDCAEQPIILLPKESAQQWIPCSERLPEELEEVNVTWVNHKPEPYYDFVKDKPFTASAVYYKGDWYWCSSVCTDLLAEYGKNEIDKIDDAIEITAWMPLPEPWRGEEP